MTRSCVANLRPPPAGETDREQAPVAGQRAGCVLGQRAADRVVDQVDAAAVGSVARARRERPVAVVDRRRRRRARGRTPPRSSSPTTAMTRAPSARPSCTAAMPLPPAAPSTASQSPVGEPAALDEADPRR